MDCYVLLILPITIQLLTSCFLPLIIPHFIITSPCIFHVTAPSPKGEVKIISDDDNNIQSLLHESPLNIPFRGLGRSFVNYQSLTLASPYHSFIPHSSLLTPHSSYLSHKTML